MRTMTDFISATSAMDSTDIIPEETYNWAEQYSEMYTESASDAIFDVYNSSGYKFYGEACFYQEAPKGLIAGGILALVSGAFLMIMKLIRGGGSGGGSSSSSSKTPSTKKLNETIEKTNEKKQELLNDFAGRMDAIDKAEEGSPTNDDEKTQTSAQEIISNRVENDTPLPNTSATVSSDQKDTEPKSAKSKEESDKKKEESSGRKYVTVKKGSKLDPRSRDKSKDTETKEDEYVKPADLEAEESITFNVKIIEDAIMKYKREGYDSIAINKGTYVLRNIITGLESIEDITDYMVRLVNEGKYEIFGSSDVKDKAVKDFKEKCAALDEKVKELHSNSKSMRKNDDLVDAEIDDVINLIKKIDSCSRSIEDKCKKGMKLCKEKRNALIQKQQDVTNVDKAYNLLNGIIRNVNVVCKDLQAAFKDIHKATKGKEHPFPMEPQQYIYLPAIGSAADYFEEFDEIMAKTLIPKNEDKVKRFLDRVVDAVRKAGFALLQSGPNSKISDKQVSTAETQLTQNASSITASMKTAKEYFAYFKREDSSHVRGYDIAWDLLERAYNHLLSVYQIPVKSLLGKTKDNCDVEAFNNFRDFWREYFEDGSSKFSEIKNKCIDAFENSQQTGSAEDDDEYKSFVESVKKNMSVLEGNLPDDRFNSFKKSVAKAIADNDDDWEDAANDVHSAVEKWVYGSDTYVDATQWTKIDAFLKACGYKPISVKAGDDVTPYRLWFARPIPATITDPTSQKPNMIKHIQLQPYKNEIKLGGKDMKLCGKCTYYKNENNQRINEGKRPNSYKEYVKAIYSNMNMLKGHMDPTNWDRFRIIVESAMDEGDNYGWSFVVGNGGVQKALETRVCGIGLPILPIRERHPNDKNWPRVEEFLIACGYERVPVAAGSPMHRNFTLFGDRTIDLKITDPSTQEEGTIKEVLRYPYRIKVENKTYTIQGICEYYPKYRKKS